MSAPILIGVALALLLPPASVAGQETAAPGSEVLSARSVRDVHGVVLVKVSDSGEKIFPYRALAAQVLAGLSQTVAHRADETAHLTLDARLQSVTEQALRAVGCGAAVLIDPSNGNVLAMASVPSFDPGRAGSKRDPDDPLDPHVNRAITAFAPGATFLPVTALAGALTGHGSETFSCDGGVTYGNKYMKCWIASKGGTHGTLDVSEALKVSCGPFFFQYGNAAGIDAIGRVGKMLGLGTGILLPDESGGILPGPEWLKTFLPRERWSSGHTANAAIGQGYVLATPLQMAMVAAALATGVSHHPRLVDRIVDATGTATSTPVSVRADLRAEGIRQEDIERIRRGMWKTVNEDGASAARARIPGIEVAGRTGTAQWWRGSEKDNVAWFIGFAPYESPKFAICVLVQGAKAAGAVAAPIVAKVLAAALDAKDLPPASPLEPAAGSMDLISE